MEYKKAKKLKNEAVHCIRKIEKAYNNHNLSCKVNNCEYISSNLRQTIHMLDFLLDAMDARSHSTEELETKLSPFKNPHIVYGMPIKEAFKVLEILLQSCKESGDEVSAHALRLIIDTFNKEV